MKVMVIFGRYCLIKELSARSDIELFILDHSDILQKYQEEKIGNRLYPYFTISKVDLQAIAQLRSAVKEVQPDVLHAFDGKSLANSVLATTFMKNAPKIVAFRGIETTASRLDPSNYIACLSPRVAGHACNCEAARRGLINSGVHPDKCYVIYKCINNVFSRPGRAGLAPWNIPDDAFVIGTVANVRYVKGMDILLEAAIECADLKDIYWVLIGSVTNPGDVKLSKDIRIRDNVRLLGYRSDAKDLISGADLFVMPSRNEGLSSALLEAMSQGVCPVVSDAGGNKEAVRNGQDGIVVPKENVQELVKAIRSLYEDRQKVNKFAQSSVNRANDFFSPLKMAERTMELYKRVVNS